MSRASMEIITVGVTNKKVTITKKEKLPSSISASFDTKRLINADISKLVFYFKRGEGSTVHKGKSMTCKGICGRKLYINTKQLNS